LAFIYGVLPFTPGRTETLANALSKSPRTSLKPQSLLPWPTWGLEDL
jgi:hypothetical protein